MTPYQHNYFQEGLDKGYFVRSASGDVWTGYSGSVLLDLSNPEAYEWMTDIIVQVRIANSILIRCYSAEGDVKWKYTTQVFMLI